MDNWIEFSGPDQTLRLFGVQLVGFSAESAKKLLFTAVLFALTWLLARVLRALTTLIDRRYERAAFWWRQAIRVLLAILLVIGVLSIWFDQPGRLATAMGLFSAGLAFALQRVVTALAGYVVILRGDTFNVGDRITMGGVRGDVVALSFIQTTIMEMGQPPAVQEADPAMWVRSRQYTGRLVRISNDKIFDTPVYNYTREFPYIWEEMTLPISYKADRAAAERILLEAASRHTVDIQEVSEEDLRELERRFRIRRSEVAPKVYWRMTDNWLELTVRFIAPDHGTRELKDAMSRDVLTQLDAAGIGIASATFEIVGVPTLRIERAAASGSSSN